MRSFLVFLAVVVVIGLVWAIKPILNDRARDHEQRLIAALNLVEEAVISSSTDILQVDLFSPEIVRLSNSGQWRVLGILETQNRLGKAVFVRFVAAVAFSCTPYGKTDCGKIETLSIDDQPLVINGAIVADLQSVLGATTDALTETLPGASVPGTASLPAPQLDTPAPEPASAPEISASEPPASEAPEPVVTAAVPDSDTGTIQGNRQIFLIQKSLNKLGYDPGPVDGQIGPQTTSAIRAYQQKAGLAVDGQPSAALLKNVEHAAE